ncbi:universal stress protein [Halogeometricum borinquense]|uniref:Universal stress protein n=2 Tax=Halogeometricum borinquense TaxID=60847 RepID=A0A6C0UM53_9EURY|nr:universal stress protein [Halogeometricum borinquense]
MSHIKSWDMYTDILVPTDGSDLAERGLEHGMELAQEHGAHLHILFVVDEAVYGSTPALSSYEAFLDKMADDAEDLAEDFIEEATEQGIDSTMSVLRGVPHEEILNYAQENNIDAIVMGKRGATGVGYPHIGSVTDRVIREAEIPVIPV